MWGWLFPRRGQFHPILDFVGRNLVRHLLDDYRVSMWNCLESRLLVNHSMGVRVPSGTTLEVGGIVRSEAANGALRMLRDGEEAMRSRKRMVPMAQKAWGMRDGDEVAKDCGTLGD